MRFSFFAGFPLPLIHHLGRVGGIGALLFSAFVAFGGVWLFLLVGPNNDPDLWSPKVAVLAIALVLISPFIALQGISLLILGRPRIPRLSDAELVKHLVSNERPLTVCLECRTICAVPPCDHCGQMSSCLEIIARSDVKNALILLNLKTVGPMALPPEMTAGFKISIRLAVSEAKRRQDKKVRVEHLLLALLEDPDCLIVLRDCGVRVDELRKRLLTFLDASSERTPLAREPEPTQELNHILEKAAEHSMLANSDVLTASDLLAEICSQDSFQAVQLLTADGADRLALFSAAGRRQGQPAHSFIASES